MVLTLGFEARSAVNLLADAPDRPCGQRQAVPTAACPNSWPTLSLSILKWVLYLLKCWGALLHSSDSQDNLSALPFKGY